MNEQNLEQSQVPKPKKGISTTTGILIALLVAVIAGGAIWYYFNYYLNPAIEKSSSETQISIPEKEATGEEEATTDETADWKTYANTKYGFTLTFPTTWEGYQVSEKNIEESIITYYFWLPTSNKSYSTEYPGYFSLFALSVYTRSQWVQEQAQEGPKCAHINENSQYVFGYMPAQDVPADPTDSIERIQEVSNIISTFQFTK